MAKNRKPDPAEVQFSWKVDLPPGAKIRKQVLKQALDYLQDNGRPPRGFEIRGIFWRNPARRGKLADWRWSAGSDLSVLIPGYDKMTVKERAAARESYGVESSPRFGHGEAVDSLSGLLRGFEF